MFQCLHLHISGICSSCGLLHLPNLCCSHHMPLTDAPYRQALAVASKLFSWSLEITIQQGFLGMPARLSDSQPLGVMKIAALCYRANSAPSVLPVGLKSPYSPNCHSSQECNKTSRTRLEAIDICQVYVQMIIFYREPNKSLEQTSQTTFSEIAGS